MDPKNCVAFRTDKLGSQEPALDLYCSKNNLIRGQQLRPYLLTQTFLDLPNTAEMFITVKGIGWMKLWYLTVKTDTLFPPIYILFLIEMTVDVDRWHVASIYG